MFLEAAKSQALLALVNDPVEAVNTHEHRVHVGIGFAVGKGWATYAGNGVFKITDEGRKALGVMLNPE